MKWVRLLSNTAATEHIYQGDYRWDDCCVLFLLDIREAYRAGRRIIIRGMLTEFYPYQVLDIFVLFEMEVFQNGGYLADAMGLGKVIRQALIELRIDG